MRQLALPDAFVQRIVAIFGDEGRKWLAGLETLLDRCARRWNLELEPPVANLSYNYVVPARRANGQPVIIKLGVPCRELRSEISALRLYDGRGSIRLLDADPEAGILLLERAIPGKMLAEYNRERDEQATRIAAQLMQRLLRPLQEGHPFTTVERWSQGFVGLRGQFHGGTGPFPPGVIEEAEATYARLLATTDRDVLLHGDLHHFNILGAEREPWLAIDPKGVAGDPAYEPGALLRNPFPAILSWPNLIAIQTQRLDILAAELPYARQRMQDWAFAQAVLSAWWSYEDEGRVGQDWLRLAESIRRA